MQRRSVSAYASSRCGARALRDPLEHELHRRRLAQLAGRHAVVVADDGGARRELARAVDARERQGRPAREPRVVVEERQERRRVARRGGDRVGADPLAVEGVVGEPPAEHPLARRAARALGRERAADLVERAQVAQVRAARAVGAVERVDVAVDQPGHERDPVAVEQLGRAAGVLAHLRVVADRDDDPVAHRNRARLRPRRSSVRIDAPRIARSACGMARATLAVAPYLAVGGQHAEPDRLAAARAGGQRRRSRGSRDPRARDRARGSRTGRHQSWKWSPHSGHSTVIGSPAVIASPADATPNDRRAVADRSTRAGSRAARRAGSPRCW